MSDDTLLIDQMISLYLEKHHTFNIYRNGVAQFFSEHPLLNAGPLPAVHSVRSRMKDPEHLRDKLRRMRNEGRDIRPDNLFQKVTDFAGVRVLHLHQAQFPLIHQEIMQRASDREWALHEDPKAYSWDPESKQFFESWGLPVQLKDSHYTSVHYVVRPRSDAPISCEIQVRTLFEEIWGEIDHAMNYPHPTQNVACREQLRVLAKLVATGSRLGDSIFRVHDIEVKAAPEAAGSVSERSGASLEHANRDEL